MEGGQPAPNLLKYIWSIVLRHVSREQLVQRLIQCPGILEQFACAILP
jgi:hypothetical protein